MFTFVRTSECRILETFGKYSRVLEPGLNVYIPFVQRKTRVIPTNLQQDNFNFTVKTRDNAFSDLGISVQYRVADPVEAHYSMGDPIDQMNAFIENVVRAEVPKMDLDDLFESQDDICRIVKATLSEKMTGLGFVIENTLLTDIRPDEKIRKAMNDVLAAKRLRDAAKYEAEADRISMVAKAEADKERKQLQGEGIAAQRKAILKGYEEGIQEFTHSTGLSSDVGAIISLTTQFYDTIERAARDGKNAIFVPYGPGQSDNIMTTIRQALLESKVFEKNG